MFSKMDKMYQMNATKFSLFKVVKISTKLISSIFFKFLYLCYLKLMQLISWNYVTDFLLFDVYVILGKTYIIKLYILEITLRDIFYSNKL